MGNLIISREKIFWQDSMRDYLIFVDGNKLGSIANGAEVTLSIEPGQHTVQLKIDWCSSPTLAIPMADGQDVTLYCGPNCKPWLTLFYAIFLRNNYLWLRFEK
jgi:hypothetical protein